MDNTTFDQLKNEFESQGNASDNAIILYANNAEQYALQQGLMSYMSSDDAAALIQEVHDSLRDGLPEGNKCFSELSREDVENVLEDVESVIIDEGDLLYMLVEFDDEQRADLYKDVIEPWFQWLKEQKPKKANNNKSSTTTSKKSNVTNMSGNFPAI